MTVISVCDGGRPTQAAAAAWIWVADRFVAQKYSACTCFVRSGPPMFLTWALHRWGHQAWKAKAWMLAKLAEDMAIPLEHHILCQSSPVNHSLYHHSLRLAFVRARTRL